MDDLITLAVSRINAKELPKAASSTKEPLYLHKIAAGCIKILKADLHTRDKSCSKDLSETIFSLVSTCCEPSVPAIIEPFCSVLELLVELSTHQTYFTSPCFSTPTKVDVLYKFLEKALSAKDSIVGDAAVRTLFVLGDLDRLDFDKNVDRVVGPLIELLIRDEKVWLSGVSALTSVYKPYSRHADKLSQLLRKLYEESEGLPLEELFLSLLSVLNNHKLIQKHNLFGLFYKQCVREDLSDALGTAIDQVFRTFGSGTVLLEELLAARRSAIYIKFLCDEFNNKNSDADRVMEMAETTREVVEGWEEVPQKMELRRAIESAVCRLALNDEMPFVDKRTRVAVRAIFSHL